jgi:hypothetical protein
MTKPHGGLPLGALVTTLLIFCLDAAAQPATRPGLRAAAGEKLLIGVAVSPGDLQDRALSSLLAAPAPTRPLTPGRPPALTPIATAARRKCSSSGPAAMVS